MGPQASAYITGLDRGVRATDVWSMRATSEKVWSERTEETPSFLPYAWWMISLSKVDFPEPDIPAIHTNWLRGIFWLKFLRLCRDAFWIRKYFKLFFPFVSVELSECLWGFFVNHFPVRECFDLSIWGTVPRKVISPPFAPAVGPSSTILSAARMTCSSCSTTQT